MDSLQTPDFLCITDHPFGAFPTLRDETSYGCWSDDVRLSSKLQSVLHHTWIQTATVVTLWARDGLHQHQQFLYSQLIVIYCVFQTFPVLTVKKLLLLEKAQHPPAQGYQDGMEYAALRAHCSSPSTPWYSRNCSCQCIGLFPSFHHYVLKVGPCTYPTEESTV